LRTKQINDIIVFLLDRRSVYLTQTLFYLSNQLKSSGPVFLPAALEANNAVAVLAYCSERIFILEIIITDELFFTVAEDTLVFLLT